MRDFRTRRIFAAGLLAVCLTGLSGVPAGPLLHELDHLLGSSGGHGRHHHHHDGHSHTHSDLVLALSGAVANASAPTALAPVPSGGGQRPVTEQEWFDRPDCGRPWIATGTLSHPVGAVPADRAQTPPTPPPIPRAS